jgi:hypothetical protein
MVRLLDSDCNENCALPPGSVCGAFSSSATESTPAGGREGAPQGLDATIALAEATVVRVAL